MSRKAGMHWSLAASRLGALVLLFALAGCLPMGMPEYFSGSLPPESAAGAPPRVLLVVPAESSFMRSRDEAGEEPGDSGEEPGDEGAAALGHQFLLGVIPFTRVYLERGVERMLFELALDVIRQQGGDPYLVREEAMHAAAKLIRPSFTVRLKLPSASVNAYDVLFFRIVSASGTIQVESFPTSPSGAMGSPYSTSVPFDESQYRRFGHGPWLSYLLERGMRGAIEKGMDRTRPGARAGARLARMKAVHSPVGRETLVLLPRPMAGGRVAEIGKRAADSYGYGGLTPLSVSAVGRMLQRGAGSAVAARGFYPVEAAERPPALRQHGMYRLEMSETVLEPAGDELLRLSCTVSLYHLDPRRQSELSRARCSVEQPLETEGDGYWVATVERAAAAAVGEFLSNGSSCRSVPR